MAKNGSGGTLTLSTVLCFGAPSGAFDTPCMRFVPVHPLALEKTRHCTILNAQTPSRSDNTLYPMADDSGLLHGPSGYAWKVS